MNLTLHIDGGSRGNPGPAGAGVVVRNADDDSLVFEGAFFLGKQTNNAAEYHGLIRGLQQVADRGAQTVSIHSDSELLVRQITGEYAVKNPKLEQLFGQAQMLLLRVPRWQIRHVRREHNKRADELANLAMDRGADAVVYDADETPPAAAAPTSGPAARAAESASPADPFVETVDGCRRVALRRVDASGTCAAGVACPTELTLDATLPAGICVYAAHAVLPTLLAMLGTDAQEFAAVPTMTVRCSHPQCGATFQLTPLRSANGQGGAE